LFSITASYVIILSFPLPTGCAKFGGCEGHVTCVCPAA
jgi:hypothetical protein